MVRVIAIGFTGNYVDYSVVREYYARVVQRIGVVTFFHPLRLVAEGFSREYMSVDDIVLESLDRGIIYSDTLKMVRRFDELVKTLSRVAHAVGVRVVFHTEYGLPLWCNELFRDRYLDVIPKLINDLSEKLRVYGLSGEFVVETHPGFTNLGTCRYRRDRLYCKDIERDLERLGRCIDLFRYELQERAGTNMIFVVEPRAGSKIYEPQSLDTHEKAYQFAKSHGLKLVLDPGQSILKQRSFEEVWNEIFDIADRDPNIVEEIHVHSPKARGGRGHGIPSPDELTKMKNLIKHLLEKRTNGTPLGIVLEILNTSPNKLLKIADEIINII
ncbi:hypothetical protein Igag_0708 [Ignisphaera aggregans DSM 17230]|uniref:Xylose isomerase-like TIM barrel domain-containing protein n=1 Tax=Ignisphaera aggregans (strain DSM 17230 / JCM 13409 / AQ1.S1) TaxID=583356 RepID=E0SSY8_IGNAA|nr:hypothetical protein Igag_0708 [Ignisphaera aggregans DSM 17230]